MLVGSVVAAAAVDCAVWLVFHGAGNCQCLEVIAASAGLPPHDDARFAVVDAAAVDELVAPDAVVAL